MPAQFLDFLSLGESGRAIAEEKKSVVCVLTRVVIRYPAVVELGGTSLI